MAYTISNPVGAGGANRKNDVSTVQFLLNCVPPGQGGANPELVKDGICGPKTTAAIQCFQKHWFGKTDSLVEPNKQTMLQLNANLPQINVQSRSCVSADSPTPYSRPMLGFAIQPVRFGIVEPHLQLPGGDSPQNRAAVYLPVLEIKPVTPIQPLSPAEQARVRVPDADPWIAHAMRILSSLIECGGDAAKLNKQPGFAVLKRHFHLTEADLKQPGFFDFSRGNTILIDLRNAYNWMSYVLRTALKEAVFINHPAEGEHENETAFVPTLSQRDGRIRFTPLYLRLGKLHQTLTLIHEAAHFVSDVVQDYVYRREKPPEYDKLPNSFAMINADSYAYFAFHCASGSDAILQNSD